MSLEDKDREFDQMFMWVKEVSEREMRALIDKMSSARAKDAVLLYLALKGSGVDKKSLTYIIHAFLSGEKNMIMENNEKGGGE